MKFSEDSKYGFVVGRVRAREALLLKRGEYERFLNINNLTEFLTLLRQIWSYETPDTANSQFEDLLSAATKENQQFFAKYCFDLPVKELFLTPIFYNPAKLQTNLKYLNNEFLNAYFILAIDLENIRSWIRIKYLATLQKQDNVEQKKLFTNQYLPNGKLNQADFLELLLMDFEDFIRWLDKTPYKSCIEPGINYLLENNSFIRLERLIAEEKQKILLLARYAIFGFEPLVSYFLLRQSEIANIKKIYYGLSENTPIHLLRESIACVL